jgi:hypothetical protein
MDMITVELLDLPKNRSIAENINIISQIYRKFKREESTPITENLVKDIFEEINRLCYANHFFDYLNQGPNVKRINIFYHNTGNRCEYTDAILEATEYDSTDPEYSTYDYGFNVAIDCLNEITHQPIYYSGGYITKSKIIFIICMLLHESIHIIEYKDSFVTTSTVEHTVFFYKYAFELFGIISRLSEIIEDPKNLSFKDDNRIADITNNITYSTAILEDGAAILNDFSHYMKKRKSILIGYITHSIFQNPDGSIRFIEDFKPVRSRSRSRSPIDNATSRRKTKRKKS